MIEYWIEFFNFKRSNGNSISIDLHWMSGIGQGLIRMTRVGQGLIRVTEIKVVTTI